MSQIKKGQYVIDETIINRKISFIVESSNMVQIFVEAEEIFNKNAKILNISVVDEEGCYIRLTGKKICCKSVLRNI